MTCEARLRSGRAALVLAIEAINDHLDGIAQCMAQQLLDAILLVFSMILNR